MAVNESSSIEVQGSRNQENGSHASEMAMDAYLSSLGLYRKPVAKDGSCLFRVVSEQVYNTQAKHINVRRECVKYMKDNAELFQGFIEGSFEHHIYHLQNPKEWAGQVEIFALSLLYKRDFVVYQSVGSEPIDVTSNGYKDKVYLCYSNGNHYDSVYPSQFKDHSSIVQALLYQHLYSAVFPEIEKRESEFLQDSDGNAVHHGLANGWKEVNRNRGKGKIGEEPQSPLSPHDQSIQWEVSRSLDPTVYRNIELEVWEQSRNDQQCSDRFFAVQAQYRVGDVCYASLKNTADLDGLYKVRIEEIEADQTIFLVTAIDINQKFQVVLEDLQPLANAKDIISYQDLPGYYRKSETPERDPEFHVNKKRARQPRRGAHAEESGPNGEGEMSATQRYNVKSKDFRKGKGPFAGGAQGPKVKGGLGDKREEDGRPRGGGKRGAHYTPGGAGGSKPDNVNRDEELKQGVKWDMPNRGKGQGDTLSKDRRDKRPAGEGKSWKRDRCLVDRRGKTANEGGKKPDAALLPLSEVDQDNGKVAVGVKEEGAALSEVPPKVDIATVEGEEGADPQSEAGKPEKIKQNFESSADFYSRMRQKQAGKANQPLSQGLVNSDSPNSTDTLASTEHLEDSVNTVNHGRSSPNHLAKTSVTGEITLPKSTVSNSSAARVQEKARVPDSVAPERPYSPVADQPASRGNVKRVSDGTQNVDPGPSQSKTLIDEKSGSDWIEGPVDFCPNTAGSSAVLAKCRDSPNSEKPETDSGLSFMDSGFYEEPVKSFSSQKQLQHEESNGPLHFSGKLPSEIAEWVPTVKAGGNADFAECPSTTLGERQTLVERQSPSSQMDSQFGVSFDNETAPIAVDRSKMSHEKGLLNDIGETEVIEQVSSLAKKNGPEPKIRILRKNEELPDVASKKQDPHDVTRQADSASRAVRSSPTGDEAPAERSAGLPSSMSGSNEVNKEKKRKKVSFVEVKQVDHFDDLSDASASSNQLPVTDVDATTESGAPCPPVASISIVNGPVPLQVTNVQNMACQDGFFSMYPTFIPTMSVDPQGRDLPEDTQVLQFFYNLGVQCYPAFHHQMHTAGYPSVPMAPSVPSHVASTALPHFSTVSESTSMAGGNHVNQGVTGFRHGVNHRSHPSPYRNSPAQSFQQPAYPSQTHPYQVGHSGMQGGPPFRQQKFYADTNHGHATELPPRFQRQLKSGGHRNMHEHGQQRQSNYRNQNSYR